MGCVSGLLILDLAGVSNGDMPRTWMSMWDQDFGPRDQLKQQLRGLAATSSGPFPVSFMPIQACSNAAGRITRSRAYIEQQSATILQAVVLSLPTSNLGRRHRCLERSFKEGRPCYQHDTIRQQDVPSGCTGLMWLL